MTIPAELIGPLRFLIIAIGIALLLYGIPKR